MRPTRRERKTLNRQLARPSDLWELNRARRLVLVDEAPMPIMATDATVESFALKHSTVLPSPFTNAGEMAEVLLDGPRSLLTRGARQRRFRSVPSGGGGRG